ncbi:RagB/SusD family nutrient uptake outer membrane protein [Pedobacter sp. MC2016-14]|uniref:RagB/SusD family nutrient uptake outer membrane protein n=1 Tax=Pedobacter sp. MC2016-14 TaxID=2897327 RepID=UPI001E3864AC|nr:RagB/SusD family nutrient uptake outer membrane protein [Pedobacter sp. MC2016-14]MCD0490494.1 RagB/SusD family nutrient uptake outer membrane protein [Pedobacter sp. MC2016-14]
MKKLAYKNMIKVVALTMVVTLGSCKKEFLEVVPKGKLLAQKVSEYNLLLSNLPLINIGASNSQVLMGDEVAAFEPYFSAAVLKTQRTFKWEDILYQPEEDAGEIVVPMTNIYLYNKVINEVPDAIEGTEQDKLRIEAEARAGRAWTYFQLINYFGKPYNENTSATDLGYPIVTEADVAETKFTRASVKEVYEFILQDLNAAIPNLPAQISHRTRMSKSAAEGILGKVLVFMGRYNEAIPHFDAAISGLQNATVPVRIYDYKVELATGGAFTPIGTNGPATPTIVNQAESVYAKQFSANWMGSSNEIVISPQTVALFSSTDLRLRWYTPTARSGPAYPANVLKKNGSTQTPFGVLVPDLYLLRAEAKVRNNDFSGAKADVEALRINRFPANDPAIAVPANIVGQKMPLLNFILNERIREFAVMGYRWFDMRRLSVDPLFMQNTYTHTIFSATGTVAETITLRPERLVMRFPQKLIDQNPGMPNNP